VNVTACSQIGCSDLASAPELSPCGAPAAATSPSRAFMNKPRPFSHSYLTSLLQNLTHTTHAVLVFASQGCEGGSPTGQRTATFD
jgi:hypothetical protein